MAKVIVPGGPFGLERAAVQPPERRVVALELHVEAGPGFITACHTPALGNRTWLHSIDVWAYECVHGVPIGGLFYLMFGGGAPVAPLEIADRWNSIIELSCGLRNAFNWFECGSFHRRLTMAKLFTTNELRFGVTLIGQYSQDWECTVAFEISEV